MSERRGFVLRVKPEQVEEYVAAHQEVWPEMLRTLSAAGIRNYTIFRSENEMFGYFETDDLERAERCLAAQPVSVRWQDAMAELLVDRVPDGGPPALEEIFRLD